MNQTKYNLFMDGPMKDRFDTEDIEGYGLVVYQNGNRLRYKRVAVYQSIGVSFIFWSCEA